MQRLSMNTASNACAASDFYAYDTSETPRNLKHCSEHCPKDLNTELHRVHTFFGWPEGTPVRPEVLAKLGFFYLGVRDKVECAFCGGVLHQWEEGDDPKTEHKRHYPHCPFIRDCATSNVPLDNPATSNVPQDSPDVGIAQQSRSGEWRNFAQQDSTLEQQSERLGHIESEPPPPPPGGTDCPKHPELSSEEDRLSTFFRWPLYSPISPRKLAQAGFYYTYIDDQVKCYWCEGGLKDWQAGDDPWTEHARWYGEECGFVLRERGIGYVRQIKNTFPSLVQVAHHHSQQDFVQDFIVGAANVTVEVGDGDPEDEFEERVLDAMDSRVVRNVVEMGFGQQNVEIVVRRRLRARRGPFTTMTDLVESLLAMDEGEDLGEDPYTEDEEDRNATGPTPTGNQEPEEPALEQMEEPEDDVDDQVRCFWCDGGLKDWQAEDDPWTEHARWYGEKCDFVLRQKTLSFVQEVKRRHPVLGQVPHEEKTFKQAFVSNGPAASVCQQTCVQDPQAETPHQAMFQEAMDSRLIQSALEMGFARQQVEKIVQKQLRRNGRPFAKMTDIVEALLAHEEGQTSDEEQINESGTKTQTVQENPPVSGAQAPLPAPTVAQGATGEEEQAPSDVISLQRQLQQLMEERMCKICMDETACMVLIPCGHMCCCENCVQMLRTRGGRCPMCRARIQRVQKTFVA
ncbi:BIRC3 [Branchiostoma lanceolatum]|uniref:RING-type E3 ubiquitin transferase n=1 Tax=Branchiostoma lanceolatum TaxID=7740 RepID=A0A8J9Z3D3_BRALA|nr:BIRC3 [Branchiostoma lanceolatum]